MSIDVEIVMHHNRGADVVCAEAMNASPRNGVAVIRDHFFIDAKGCWTDIAKKIKEAQLCGEFQHYQKDSDGVLKNDGIQRIFLLFVRIFIYLQIVN